MLLLTIVALAIVHITKGEYVNFYKQLCTNALTNETTKCWSMVSEIYMDSTAPTQEKAYTYPDISTLIKVSASITNVTAGIYDVQSNP